MATKKSVLNNNLGLASDIGSYISYKQGTYTNRVYLPYGASIPTEWIGFKQPASRVNPYQVQWRQTFRRTKPEAVKAGADWTGWTSAWKNTTAVPAQGGMAQIAPDSTVDADTWLRGSKGVDNGSMCTWAKTIQNFSISAQYDATSIAIRVRTFNYATLKHGAWAQAEIKYFRCSDVKDINAIIAPDSGLYIAFNYSHTRGVNAEIHSIKLNGVEVFTGDASLRRAVVQQARNASTVPKNRNNYTGGMIHVEGKDITRSLAAGSTIDIDFTLYTDLGAPTHVKQAVRISGATTTVTAPLIEFDADTDTGIVTVTMKRQKADEIYNDVGIRCYYITQDGTMKIQPLAETKTPEKTAVDDVVCISKFAVDMDGATYRFYGYISNVYDLTRWSNNVQWQAPTTNFAYIDGMGEISNVHAVLAGDISLSIDREATVTAEKPVEASNNMAAWYTGTAGRFTLYGTILDGRYQGDSIENAITVSNTIDALIKVSKTAGKYKVRMPDRRSYVGVLETVSINQEDAFKAEISIDFIEVVS